MANSFVKNLGKVIYQEYSVLQHDALEESFKNAVTKLPKGTLRTKLTTNYDKYLAALEKKIVKLSEKDSVNKCGTDSDSLEELASLGGRKDVEDHNTVKLVFSLRDKKQLTLPNEGIMKDCSKEQKKKIYDVFLGTVLSRPGVDKSIFQEVIDKLIPLLPDQSSDRKVQFDWFPSMCHVIQLCSRTSPLSVIRVLQLLFAAVAPDVENCILKEKVIRAGKIAGILKSFLNICKMKTDCSKMTPLEEKQYRNLLSALLSYYTDLSCLHSRKLNKKKQFGRQLCGFVSYLLQPWPESLLEVVLQLDMMEENTANVLVPLVRQCLLLKPAGQDAQYYLKYMLLVRKVKDSLGSLDTLLEYTVLANNIPAPVGFLDWLQDKCPEAMDSMPVEDKKFKKVRVTRYLLREADEELIELLKESLEDPSGDAPSVDKMEIEADDTSTTTQDSLFFIDKGTSKGSQDPVPKARSRIIESTSSEVLTPSKSGKGRLKELHQDEAPSDVTTHKQKSSSKPLEKNAFSKKKQKLQSAEPEPKQKEKQPANELEPKKKSTIKFGQKEFTETDSDISPQKKATTPGTVKRLQSLVSSVTPNKPVNGNPLQANMLGMGVDEEGQSSLSTSLQSLNGSSTSGGGAWTDDTINTYESDVSDMDANKDKKEEEPESGSVISIDSTDDESKDENDITALYVATKVSNESNLAVNDTTLKLSEEKVEETDDEEEKEIHLEISETENEEEDKEKAVVSVKESDEEEKDKDEDKDKDNEQKQKINAESDTDVFVGSPRKRALNKESVQAKFIGKAIRSRTPKSAEKSAKAQEQKLEGSVSIFSDNSDKEEDETSHVQNVRTRSTEEIVTIVEDIKQKLQSSTPRQSKKGNDDSKMFTDDSVESLEAGNTETEDERKESPSKMNRSNRKSPRKSDSSHTEDVSPFKTPSGRKSSKKAESSDEDIVEIAGERDPDGDEEVTMKNLTPQKMKSVLETVKSADLIESATDLSELDDVLEDSSAAELADNGEKGKEKLKASKVPLDMIVSPKRGGAVNEGHKGRGRSSKSSDQREDEQKVSKTPDSACENNLLKIDADEIVVSDDESDTSSKEKSSKTAEKKTPLKENVKTAQDENKKTPSKEMVMKKTPRKGNDENDVEVEEGNDDKEIIPKIPTPKSAGKQVIQQNVSAKKPRRKSSKEKADENEANGNDNDDENFIATSPTQKSPSEKATQENGSAKKTQKKSLELNAEENENNDGEAIVARSPTLKSPSKNEVQQNTSNSARKRGRKSSRDKTEEDESDNEVLSSHTPKSASKKESQLNGSAKKSLRKSLRDESDELEDESEKKEKTPLKVKSPLDKEKQLSGQKRKLSDKTDKSKQVEDQEQGSACREEITELLVSPEKKKLKTPEKVTTPKEVAKQASSQEKQNRRKRGSESDSTETMMSPKSKTDKEEAKSKSAEKMKTPIQTSKPDADQQEDDSDFVPSSVKKQKNTRKSLAIKSPRTRKAEIVLSDSDSEMEPKVNSVPDIGMHLQDDHNDADVKTDAKSPHIPKIAETKVSAENKRRSVRRGNIESDIESADSKAEPTKADQPSQRKPRRSVAKVTVVEPPLTPRTTRGRASDMSETDQSDAEARTRRKSVGPRMTTIKEKEPPAKSATPSTTQATAKSITPAATHARTPQTKPNVRKLSASTTKKAVQQESTTVGGRKRRLSLSQADSDAASAANSTDSEVSFPKQKKGKDPVPTQSQLTTTATRARRQSKVKEDETVDTGPVRRSGRKK